MKPAFLILAKQAKQACFIFAFIFAFAFNCQSWDQTDTDSSVKEMDGKVLWRIFDESHVPATEEISSTGRATVKYQKRYMLNFHSGWHISKGWLLGFGDEIRIVNIVFPITLAGNFDVSKDFSNEGYLSLGLNVHFPGNLLSSNAGTGLFRNVLSDDITRYYGLFGIELMNIIYCEYQAVRKEADILRFGLRFFM